MNSFFKKTRANFTGFSLVEVMVAVGILTMVVVTIAAAWSGNFLRIRKSRLNHNVASLLERKVVELEIKFKNQPIEEIVDESGDFGKDFPQYRWEFKIKDFEMPDLTPLLVSRDEGADEILLSMIRQTTEFISKSVKEGTVSIFVKFGKKKREVEYNVTMYFVDYNQPLLMGGG